MWPEGENRETVVGKIKFWKSYEWVENQGEPWIHSTIDIKFKSHLLDPYNYSSLSYDWQLSLFIFETCLPTIWVHKCGILLPQYTRMISHGNSFQANVTFISVQRMILAVIFGYTIIVTLYRTQWFSTKWGFYHKPLCRKHQILEVISFEKVAGPNNRVEK